MNSCSSGKVLASVLNWNNHALTSRCVKALLEVIQPQNVQLDILVIDNGSNLEDYSQLSQSLSHLNVKLIRNKANLGFADGHNYSIRYAIDADYTHIWLVNNDAIVNSSVLVDCLDTFIDQQKLGAVSPCLAYEDDPLEVYFCGSSHNWKSLTLDPDGSNSFGKDVSSTNQWIWATVAIYLIDAIRETGYLESKYFAYFEDNDISERLRKAGWRTAVCKNNIVLHSKKSESANIRHAYYYYLNCRNYQLFFQTHTPSGFRGNLRIRLLSRAINQVAKLREKKSFAAADAALSGCVDGFFGKSGTPNIPRKPSYLGRILYGMWTLKNKFDASRQAQRL